MAALAGFVSVRRAAVLASLGPFAVVSGAFAQAQERCPAGTTLVPGGAYTMGSPSGFRDEQPPLRVTVAPYCLEDTEVTVRAYGACVRDGRCTPPALHVRWTEMAPEEEPAWAAYCNGLRADRMDHPVNCIEFAQADTYCRAIGRRLPTEAEWEFAARGGDEERTYPWGEDAPSATRLNACADECRVAIERIRGWGSLYPGNDGFVGTAPVGSFPAGRGRWGHVDLAANVYEWTSTPYCPYDHQDCESVVRSARGTGFLQTAVRKIRGARRNKDADWHVSADVGVRCAASLDGSQPVPRPLAPARTVSYARPGSARWRALLGIAAAGTVLVGFVFGPFADGAASAFLPWAQGITGFETPSTLLFGAESGALFAAVYALVHWRRIDRRVAGPFAVTYALCAAAGMHASVRLPPAVPPFARASLALAAAVALLLRARRTSSPGAPRGLVVTALLATLLGALSGASAGFAGAPAGAFVAVPCLVVVARLAPAPAFATAAVALSFAGLAASRVLLRIAAVDSRFVLGAALALVPGALLGAFVHRRVTLRTLAAIALLLAAVQLVTYPFLTFN